MEIIWHGQSCFTIKSGDITIITDPYENEIGLKLPNLKADLVTISHEHKDHNNSTAIEGNPKILNWPGEYEVSGIQIQGIEAFHYSQSDDEKAENRGKTIIFTFALEGMKVCHLGDLGHRLTNEMTEAIGDTDLLFIPVGGLTTIDAKKAHEVIEQIEPRLVIPMHYKVDGLKMEIDGIEPFLKEIGQKDLEPIEKLRLKKTDLPEAEMRFVLFKI